MQVAVSVLTTIVSSWYQPPAYCVVTAQLTHTSSLHTYSQATDRGMQSQQGWAEKLGFLKIIID